MVVSNQFKVRGVRAALLAVFATVSLQGAIAADVTNLQAVPGSISYVQKTADVLLSWQPPVGSAEGIEYVILQSENDKTFTIIGRTRGLSYQISGLGQNKRFYFAVAESDGEISFTRFNVSTSVLTDSDEDGDGILTSEECPNFDLANPAACPDTDKDGIPNYLDQDDDNDGILTSLESEAEDGSRLDSDNDSVPDYLEPNNLDTDGDGVPNHLDPDDDGDAALYGPDFDTRGEVKGQPLNPPDSDGDGIPDYLDVDSDSSDGTNDSDGDGKPDTEECKTPPFCSEDEDGDGLPDYMDDTNDNLNPEAAAAKGSIVTGKDGAGGGAMGLLGLLPLAGAAMLRRRRQSLSRGPLKSQAALKSLTLIVPVCLIALTPSLQAGETQWYLGGGVGASNVDPDTSRVTGVTVDDDRDTGFKLFGGYDFTNHWSIEGFVADLGESTLSDGDEVSYELYGVSGLYHYPASLAGFSGFLKAGIAHLRNDSKASILQENDTQAFLGLGLEKQFLNGISVRGEYEYFAEDATLASISVLKRFGELPTGPEPEVVVVEREVPAPAEPDSDGDGIVDSQDQCPGTPPNTEVDAKGCEFDLDRDGVLNVDDLCPDTPAGMPVHANGCPKFTGVLEGVNFELNKAILTSRAKVILDGIAQQMMSYPSLNVVVVGHTDSTGSDAHNQKLSVARAKSVSDYLVSKGVRAQRMKFAGYGERFPRATNETENGRALNRRVELLPQK